MVEANERDPIRNADDVLREAWQVQEDASAVGFDWPDVHGVMAKVREETDEIQAALDANDQSHAARELGDLLFVCVNLARFLRARPEHVLTQAMETFKNRFNMLKEELAREGKETQSCSLDELDRVWNRVKVLTHQPSKKRVDK